jgi:hypothetical protein
MPAKGPMDQSLAFTALLEFYPGYRDMDARKGEQLTRELLESFYASDGKHTMIEHARQWSREHAQAESRPAPSLTELEQARDTARAAYWASPSDATSDAWDAARQAIAQHHAGHEHDPDYACLPAADAPRDDYRADAPGGRYDYWAHSREHEREP